MRDRQTLRDWVLRFNQAGIEGLRDQPRSGRPSFLSDGQLATLRGLRALLRASPMEIGSIAC
jgi:putative transposase